MALKTNRSLVLPLLLAAVPVAGCGAEPGDDADLGEASLAGTKTQGTKTQGTGLGAGLLYAKYAGGTLGGYPVTSLQVHEGELRGVQVRGSVLRYVSGRQLVDTFLRGTTPAQPNLTKTLWVRGVSDPVRDFGNRGVAATDETSVTRFYDVQVRNGSTWEPLCEPDQFDGASWAIPVAATWNSSGDRVESSTDFTFACASGVIAKCYAWGYRPYRYRDAHQACTRAATADYCGDGRTHTMPGTTINMYDELTASGVQSRAFRPDLLFEAGWTTAGARCLSHYRWANLPIESPTALCPTPGRRLPFAQPGDPGSPPQPVGWNCPVGTYPGPGGACIAAHTGTGAPAGWVCDSCADARAVAKGLKMSLPIWECEDSANNVFVR